MPTISRPMPPIARPDWEALVRRAWDAQTPQAKAEFDRAWADAWRHVFYPTGLVPEPERTAHAARAAQGRTLAAATRFR